MSHLTYFKVQNFKCFDEIEVKEFGQYNLIVGDNNVGKTALMEAMMVDFHIHQTILNFLDSSMVRGLEINSLEKFSDYLAKGSLPIKFKFNVRSVFQVEGENEQTQSRDFSMWFSTNAFFSTVIKFSNDVEPAAANSVFFKDFSNNISNLSDLTRDFTNRNNEPVYLRVSKWFPMIGVSEISAKQVSALFGATIGKDKKKLGELIQSSRIIISDLEDLRVIEENLVFGLETGGDFQPVSTLGFASNRWLQILFNLFKFQDRKLFIDEIDTGIHHSRLPEFIKTILTLAKEFNVQLFMTTHSKECEKAFVQVLSEDKEQSDRFRSISLFRTKEGKISNTVRKFEQYEGSLSRGFELRGR